MAVSIYRKNGPVHVEFYPKAASTAIAFGEPVYLNTDGRLAPYTPAVAGPFLGLCKKEIAATDDDFASTTRIPVEVGNAETEYVITASSTSAGATDVGEYCDYVEATVSVNVGSSSADDFYVTQVISTTLVVGKFARRIVSKSATLE